MNSGELNRIRTRKPRDALTKRNESRAALYFDAGVLLPIIYTMIASSHLDERGLFLMICVYAVGFGFVLAGRRLDPKSLWGRFLFAFYVFGFLFVVGIELWG
jgi:hypothetical protein